MRMCSVSYRQPSGHQFIEQMTNLAPSLVGFDYTDFLLEIMRLEKSCMHDNSLGHPSQVLGLGLQLLIVRGGCLSLPLDFFY
jgi:hypothetical protein